MVILSTPTMTGEEIEEERKQKLAKEERKKKKHEIVTNMKNATQHGSNVFTRSKPFQALVNKAFTACDLNQSGDVSRSELYSSLLYVHITLARYAGPTACFPPSREVSDQLFDAADIDKSNGIDKIEFESILMCCCAQILSRMMVYYSVLILFVPWLARHVLEDVLGRFVYRIPSGSYWEVAAKETISLSIFMGAIPLLWNAIDTQTTNTITRMEQPPNNSTTTTAGSSSSSSRNSETDMKEE
mmetsp:Transcript_36675/g.40983  ORF Transcript_36675/g.40983 Transcript_36675/m.40983 type:complete len:243 (+) Transcript_36675:128-856(+)